MYSVPQRFLINEYQRYPKEWDFDRLKEKFAEVPVHCDEITWATVDRCVSYVIRFLINSHLYN
jgi:hypothetical protein